MPIRASISGALNIRAHILVALITLFSANKNLPGTFLQNYRHAPPPTYAGE